jgi:transcriptional regulator with XRE-family HTH domain
MPECGYMKGIGRDLSIGDRVAYYRRRRGLTQVALAGLVARTPSWVEKVENGRAPLDRISVVRELASALDVSLHDFLPDDIAAVEPDRRGQSVPALRDLVLSYRAVNPRFALLDADVAVPPIADLRAMVNDVWTAYQDSKFGYVVMRLNQVLPIAYLATRQPRDVAEAKRCLAFLYQAAASVLVKLGDLDLARLCADRGDIAAQDAGDPITLASLQRSIAHSLLSNGQYEDAVAIVREGVIDAADLDGAAGLSVTGTLMLVGATASARAGARAEASAFLQHADRLADRLGGDRNEVWTSFGPTNVAIHKVTVAAELGDIQTAIDLGSELDVSAMPRERRMRHQLEVARALFRAGRGDESLAALLSAEQTAPEQVRRHFLTHEIVHAFVRTARARPNPDLVALARRLGHAA